MSHDHIINLFDVFDESTYYYLITEIMLGGELFDRIVTKTFYNEKEARDVCKTLFQAIAYCHSRGVAHRDLKPENLLLVSRSDDKKNNKETYVLQVRSGQQTCLSRGLSNGHNMMRKTRYNDYPNKLFEIILLKLQAKHFLIEVCILVNM
jgi:serine/threonine protein kinase